jgi:nickel/cobalt transporter (NiCoT) family protein
LVPLNPSAGSSGRPFPHSFLLAIAIANIIILIAVYRTFQHVKRGGRFVDEDLNLILAKRGFFGRIFRNLFRLIEHSWQMYPVGFLFGLGFDTATEVGLLGISATEATKGLSIWSILVFPTLFTAGMALIDSTDSILIVDFPTWQRRAIPTFDDPFYQPADEFFPANSTNRPDV